MRTQVSKHPVSAMASVNSRVDKQKYPDVKQKYRFDLAELAENNWHIGLEKF